jgi:hypothetical protein
LRDLSYHTFYTFLTSLSFLSCYFVLALVSFKIFVELAQPPAASNDDLRAAGDRVPSRLRRPLLFCCELSLNKFHCHVFMMENLQLCRSVLTICQTYWHKVTHWTQVSPQMSPQMRLKRRENNNKSELKRNLDTSSSSSSAQYSPLLDIDFSKFSPSRSTFGYSHPAPTSRPAQIVTPPGLRSSLPLTRHFNSRTRLPSGFWVYG